jgi:hypothetical protein
MGLPPPLLPPNPEAVRLSHRTGWLYTRNVCGSFMSNQSSGFPGGEDSYYKVWWVVTDVSEEHYASIYRGHYMTRRHNPEDDNIQVSCRI